MYAQFSIDCYFLCKVQYYYVIITSVWDFIIIAMCMALQPHTY